jgi:RimJ/RimL family protein N-acetyltransferase
VNSSERVMELAGRADQPFWAVRPHHSGVAQGRLSLCDIYPVDGAIEIGSIWFSPLLQRTRAATEANFLPMQYAMAI